MNRTRVMVYGSLKEGEINNDALTRHNGKLLGPVGITGPYRMYNWSWFPAVSTDPTWDQRTIHGEVWEIDEDGLAVLDIIEGHPHFFKREKVDTPYKRAWIYMMNPEYVDERKPVNESGVWLGEESYANV